MYLIGVVYICFEIHVGFLKVVYLYPLYLYTELQREIFFGGGVRKEVSKTITLFRGFLHRYSLPYFLTRFLTDFLHILHADFNGEQLYRILLKQIGHFWPRSFRFGSRYSQKCNLFSQKRIKCSRVPSPLPIVYKQFSTVWCPLGFKNARTTAKRCKYHRHKLCCGIKTPTPKQYDDFLLLWLSKYTSCHFIPLI